MKNYAKKKHVDDFEKKFVGMCDYIWNKVEYQSVKTLVSELSTGTNQKRLANSVPYASRKFTELILMQFINTLYV